MQIIVGALAASAAAFGSAPEPRELAPGLWTADKIQLEGRALSVGMGIEELLIALGSDVKFPSKPARTSTAKLRQESAVALRLSPQPALLKYFDEAFQDCGVCWMGLVSKKIGKNEEMRFLLMGPTSDSLTVRRLILDHGYGANRLKRAVLDALSGTTYVITDDEVYKISLGVNAVIIERRR